MFPGHVKNMQEAFQDATKRPYGYLLDVALANAPINVKPAGGRRGIGRDFDIFPKIAVKFPTPGQKYEVKCNWNSPPKEVICGDGHE